MMIESSDSRKRIYGIIAVWLIFNLIVIFLSSCRKDENQLATITKKSLIPICSSNEPYRKTWILEECVQQKIAIPHSGSPLIEDDLSSLIDERIKTFNGTLEIEIQISEILIIDHDWPLCDMRTTFIVRFRNKTSDSIVVRIPNIANTVPSEFELGIEVYDENYQLIGPLHFASKDIQVLDEKEFIMIPPMKNHCEQYQTYWLFIDSEERWEMIGDVGYLHIPRGKYYLRVTYTNDIIGYSSFDLNAWVGDIESNIVEFSIP